MHFDTGDDSAPSSLSDSDSDDPPFVYHSPEQHEVEQSVHDNESIHSEDANSDKAGSFFEDSDYEVDEDQAVHENEDDVMFEQYVEDVNNVEEYEEMEYAGHCSNDEAMSEGFESLRGSGTEEDEEGNEIQILGKKYEAIPWRREVDLKKVKFKCGHAFANAEELKEAGREYNLQKRRAIWFNKNCKMKIEGEYTFTEGFAPRKSVPRAPETQVRSRKSFLKQKTLLESIQGSQSSQPSNSSPTQASQNPVATRRQN